MKVLILCVFALIFINYSEALRCYACAQRGCSGYREECGSLLQNPVCAIVDSPNIYMKGCMSEYICREQQQTPGIHAVCCGTDFCNR